MSERRGAHGENVTVSDPEVRAMVSMTAAIEAVRAAFDSLRSGDFDMPVRQAPGDGSLLVMTAYHRPTRSAIVKTLSYNLEREPSLSGSLGWFELDTTRTYTADAQAVTTLRTGAIVGVATDLLAVADTAGLAMIGAGAQARDQIAAVCAVRPIRRVAVFDRDAARAEALVEDVATEFPGIKARLATGIRDAVEDADIVNCATTSRDPLFEASWLRPRVHVNAIGAFRPNMHELPQELLVEALVVVDDLAACRVESGEIIDALDSGRLTEQDVIELSDLLGTPIARRPRTVFKTVGIPVQDWAIGAALARAVLIPEPQAWKDDHDD